jgi:hypothetical protein
MPGLNTLEGRKIAVVHLHRWGGQLVLDDEGPSITIGFDTVVNFKGADGNTIEVEDLRTAGGVLCSLLNLKIEKVQTQSPNTQYKDYQLILDIETGLQLEILQDAFVNVDGTQIFPKG